MSLDTSARPPTLVPPPVRPDQEAAIRARLADHRQARQDQIKAHTFADPHSSDLAPRMRALAVAKLTLLEIDQALLRFDDGSYGFRLGCAKPIPTERPLLLAVPYARQGVPCA